MQNLAATEPEPEANSLETATDARLTMHDVRAGAGCPRCPGILNDLTTRDGQRHVRCRNCGCTEEVVR